MDLTPIFKDYKAHLRDIDGKVGVALVRCHRGGENKDGCGFSTRVKVGVTSAKLGLKLMAKYM